MIWLCVLHNILPDLWVFMELEKSDLETWIGLYFCFLFFFHVTTWSFVSSFRVFPLHFQLFFFSSSRELAFLNVRVKCFSAGVRVSYI